MSTRKESLVGSVILIGTGLHSSNCLFPVMGGLFFCFFFMFLRGEDQFFAFLLPRRDRCKIGSGNRFLSILRLLPECLKLCSALRPWALNFDPSLNAFWLESFEQSEILRIEWDFSLKRYLNKALFLYVSCFNAIFTTLIWDWAKDNIKYVRLGKFYN